MSFMSAFPWVVAALIALSTMAFVYLAVRGLDRGARLFLQVRDRPEMESTALPFWLRFPSALLAPSAGWLGPFIPIALRESIQELLNQAGFEELLTPPQMVAVALLIGVLGSGCALALGSAPWLVFLVTLAGVSAPWLWMRSEVTKRRDQVIRELPMYVDMLTLALEAGGRGRGHGLRGGQEKAPGRRAVQASSLRCSTSCRQGSSPTWPER